MEIVEALWAEPVLRVIGGLATIAGGIFGWFYFRRLAVDAAEGRLTKAQVATIHTLESEVASLRRQMDTHVTNVEECEKRLRKTEQALDKWDEMLGSIWVRDFGEPS